jgi:plasmid stabilization system protein ParE
MMPGMGHERPELRGHRYRVWAVYSYLIIYRYGPKTLTIGVVHGARNLRRLFKRR